MKWILSTAFVAAVSVAMNAQSAKSEDGSMSDMHKQLTYTGCIEVVNHGATFMLTHVADGHHGTDGDMAMKNDNSHMSADMTPNTLVLAGRELSNYAGQRVSITGSRSKGMAGSMRDDLETLTISSLKVLAKSCM